MSNLEYSFLVCAVLVTPHLSAAYAVGFAVGFAIMAIVKEVRS